MINTKALLEPMGSWAWWRSWIQLFVGCAIMGSGFVFFINPYNFVPGGVYGAGIVLHNIFPSIQVGTFGYMFDVPLMITAVLVFGGQFGARTVVAALFTPGFMNILTRLVYSDAAFTADGINLDPALLLGGSLNLSNDLLLTCIIGAVVIGVGQGMVVRTQATTGGTDIIAAIIHKYRDVTLGRMIMACDVIIISSCYFIFNDWRRVIFGFVTLFVIGIVLDYIVNGARQSVQFFIFSKEYEKIADRITKETHRGVTVLDGIGWYSKHNVKVLVVLAYKRQSVEIFRMVKDIDPNAFISQSSVIGVYGEGFDRLKVK